MVEVLEVLDELEVEVLEVLDVGNRVVDVVGPLGADEGELGGLVTGTVVEGAPPGVDTVGGGVVEGACLSGWVSDGAVPVLDVG